MCGLPTLFHNVRLGSVVGLPFACGWRRGRASRNSRLDPTVGNYPPLGQELLLGIIQWWVRKPIRLLRCLLHGSWVHGCAVSSRLSSASLANGWTVVTRLFHNPSSDSCHNWRLFFVPLNGFFLPDPFAEILLFSCLSFPITRSAYPK